MFKILGAFIAMMVFMLLLVVAFYVVTSLGKRAIFRKLDMKESTAWIPCYSDYVLFKLGWESNAYIVYIIALFSSCLIGAIPFLGTVLIVPGLAVTYAVLALMCLKLAAAFGLDFKFAIGLMFLPFVFYFILAKDEYEYIGEQIIQY